LPGRDHPPLHRRCFYRSDLGQQQRGRVCSTGLLSALRGIDSRAPRIDVAAVRTPRRVDESGFLTDPHLGFTPPPPVELQHPCVCRFAPPHLRSFIHKNAAAFAGLAHLWGLFCPLRLHIPMQQLDPTVCRAFLPRRQLGLVRTLRGGSPARCRLA